MGYSVTWDPRLDLEVVPPNAMFPKTDVKAKHISVLGKEIFYDPPVIELNPLFQDVMVNITQFMISSLTMG